MELSKTFKDAIKTTAERKLGVELEFFLVNPQTFKLVSYFEEAGVRDVLNQLASRYGWHPKFEAGEIIALSRNGANITLEPSGTIEFDSVPTFPIADIENQIRQFCTELSNVTQSMDRDILTAGILPYDSPEDTPLVPKSRYDVMWNYMPKVGSRGREMMKLTAAIQISIDYTSEEDARETFRLASCLTPYLIALSANSHFSYGKHSGRASERGDIWLNTDEARTTLPAKAYREGLSFADYAEWATNVPIYYLERNSEKLILHDYTFSDLLKGKVSVDGETLSATADDWELHLSTLFPPVRYRRYVEIRHFDMNPPRFQMAFLALVKGLFYDLEARDELSKVIGSGAEELYPQVIATGLESIKEEAKSVVEIACAGLRRISAGEERYLDPLCEKIETASSPDLVGEAYLKSQLLSSNLESD